MNRLTVEVVAGAWRGLRLNYVHHGNGRINRSRVRVGIKGGEAGSTVQWQQVGRVVKLIVSPVNP